MTGKYLDDAGARQIITEVNKKASLTEMVSARVGEVDLATKIGKIDTSLSQKASQVEIENARKGEVDLATKIGSIDVLVSAKANQVDLDATNAKVATKASTAYVDTKVDSIASGSPKGTYGTLALLTSAYPNGDTGNYVVATDGIIYNWNTTTSLWTSTGIVYQATGIADKSITQEKLAFETVIGTKGKNLIDSTKVTVGKYPAYNTGVLTTASGYNATDFIPVSSGQYYTYNYAGQAHICFYNANKTYTSGFLKGDGSYCPVFQVPEGSAFVRMSLFDNAVSTSQLELGISATYFEKFQNFIEQQKVIGVSDITNSFYMGKNLFDKTKIISKFYVETTTGKLVKHVDYFTSDFIAVTSLKNYVISKKYNTQLAFYDSNKMFISGTLPTTSFQVPTNATYLRFSTELVSLNTIQLEQRKISSNFENFGYKSTKTNEIYLKADGTGDYASLRLAIQSITDNSKTNPYNIYLYEGEYDILSAYTEAEIKTVSFVGLNIPNYVNLYGIGKKENIILKGYLDSTIYDTTTQERVTGINPPPLDCIMQNLTITGQNNRYAVHDDYNVIGTHTYNDCIFIKYSGGGLGASFGSGCLSGGKLLFDGCKFISSSPPFFWHNNSSLTSPCGVKFNNCEFINTSKGIVGSNSYSVLLSSLASGTDDIVEFNNCRMPRGFKLYESTAGNGIYINVKGYGNIPAKNYMTANLYNFNEEIREMVCGTTTGITKKTPIKIDIYGNAIAMLTTDSTLLFDGVALEDIAYGATGLIRYSGYIAPNEVSFNSATIGDKVGVVNGALAVVSSGDYIGVVVAGGEWGNYVKLI